MPAKSKTDGVEKAVVDNKKYNEDLLKRKVMGNDDRRWFDCEVTGVIIGSHTTIEVKGVDVLKTISYDGIAALRVGDKISVMISTISVARTKPEYDEVNGVWKKPKPEEQSVWVLRDLNEEEEAFAINVLDGDGNILCKYVL